MKVRIGFGVVTALYINCCAAVTPVPYQTVDALTAFDTGCVTLQGRIGEKADAWIQARMKSVHARGKVFDECVEAFRTKWDDTYKPPAGFWQGEYWGKTMLGYTGAYRYTRDPELKAFIRTKALELIREFQEPDGYLGTYANKYAIGAKPPAKPWTVWSCNLWNRKYTIWGLTEAAQVTGDDEIRAGAIKAMDHWIASVRHENLPVRLTGGFSGFMSMNQSCASACRTRLPQSRRSTERICRTRMALLT